MIEAEYSLAVIIPNYNKEKYIRRCINSVLEQTYNLNEILIVDDCSTDQSPIIIKEMSEENAKIHPIFLKKNQGVSHARNVGIVKCKSEYITFLDSDDYYGNNNKLMNEMMLIKRGKGSNILAYSKLAFCDEEGEHVWQPNMKKYKYMEGNVCSRLVSGKFDFSTIARDYCVKKSVVLDVGGYNENRCLYEDLELLIKLSKQCKFLCTKEWGSVYRQNTYGLSHRTSQELDREFHSVLSEGMIGLAFIDRFIIICIKCINKVKSFLLFVLCYLYRLLKGRK